MGTDGYFIPRGCPSSMHRMGVLRCTFVLLGLVVASLAGMIDQDLLCDRFDPFSNTYLPMHYPSVEEVAWECNTDTAPGGKCDKIQANCYKGNNDYYDTGNTNHIDVVREDYVEYIDGDNDSYCQRICEGVFDRVQRVKQMGLPPVFLARVINRMKTGSSKHPLM